MAAHDDPNWSPNLGRAVPRAIGVLAPHPLSTLSDAEVMALGRPKQYQSQDNAVNHPPHYTSGGIETIDFIEAKGLGFALGNAVKYIVRKGKKVFDNNVDSKLQQIQDLEKAIWYLQHEIQNLKKG
jgi:Protein of unknwon function (DUF3310)